MNAVFHRIFGYGENIRSNVFALISILAAVLIVLFPVWYPHFYPPSEHSTTALHADKSEEAKEFNAIQFQREYGSPTVQSGPLSEGLTLRIDPYNGCQYLETIHGLAARNDGHGDQMGCRK